MVLFGGLFGAQAVGREVLIRLARHLSHGWRTQDKRVMTLLSRTEIYIAPAVDKEGFERVKEGGSILGRFVLIRCTALKPTESPVRNHRFLQASSISKHAFIGDF